MEKKSSLISVSLLKIIVPLVIFLSAVFVIISLNQSTSFYPKDLGYIGVFTLNDHPPDYFIGINPDIEKNSLQVLMGETGPWENQSPCKIIIPKEATNISFLVMPDNETEISPDKIVQCSMADRVPYEIYENQSSVFTTTEDTAFGTLIIKPKKIHRYFGVEFILPGWISQRSPSQVSIVIPLLNGNGGGSQDLTGIDNFSVQMTVPSDYELLSSVPQSSRFKVNGNNQAMYQFSINASNTDFVATLENHLKSSNINNLRVFLGILIGVTPMPIIMGIIDLIQKRRKKR